ncbi:YkvA family protein [Gracilibacillus caseinilyticus]|uniref:YkvA family protein n=1 Tax=Gracilibacillus caseinilyticus TaxID=2932256 RepID=A0ABY4F171_9BACI|nr:YkvA family protein [Gracilibacillus caseinilyticus]UOQ49966.1 YkvA family protein [Gracilibacillus caseinilyticus]
MKYKYGYKKYISKARSYFQDKEKSKQLLKEAEIKANDKKGKLEEVWDKLQLLFEALRAWIKEEYKEIPKGSIVMIIAAIIYFVTPIDIVPDFLVGLGLFDDAAVLGFVIKQVSEDLDRFKVWQENHDAEEPPYGENKGD